MSALTDHTIYTEVEPLAKGLERIINTGLIKQTQSRKEIVPGILIDNIYLSKQEIHCLRHLITGKTFKLIGQALQLSPRTVEHYIENIKRKLNVKTRQELIEKVIQQI
jgi:DNA-binding CsgD family transcriptional regulator